MSFDRTVSLFHGTYAVWNVIQCVPLLTSGTTPTGYALTYPPFAVGTNLSLAVASKSFRDLHSMLSIVVCAPHLILGNAKGAMWHAGAGYMHVHGPTSLPALGMVGAALYLCRPKQDEATAKAKSQ